MNCSDRPTGREPRIDATHSFAGTALRHQLLPRCPTHPSRTISLPRCCDLDLCFPARGQQMNVQTSPPRASVRKKPSGADLFRPWEARIPQLHQHTGKEGAVPDTRFSSETRRAEKLTMPPPSAEWPVAGSSRYHGKAQVSRESPQFSARHGGHMDIVSVSRIPARARWSKCDRGRLPPRSHQKQSVST